jgi:hypothetical protein
MMDIREVGYRCSGGMSQDEENGMVTRFKVNEFGRTFATRERGAELREQLTQRLGSASAVVVDFEGVTNISYSFADEFLGKLCADGGVRVETANARSGIERIVGRAVGRRAGAHAGC